jgi:hypothetical protein
LNCTRPVTHFSLYQLHRTSSCGSSKLLSSILDGICTFERLETRRKKRIKVANAPRNEKKEGQYLPSVTMTTKCMQMMMGDSIYVIAGGNPGKETQDMNINQVGKAFWNLSIAVENVLIRDCRKRGEI